MNIPSGLILCLVRVEFRPSFQPAVGCVEGTGVADLVEAFSKAVDVVGGILETIVRLRTYESDVAEGSSGEFVSSFLISEAKVGEGCDRPITEE